jgi:hypothetical protein
MGWAAERSAAGGQRSVFDVDQDRAVEALRLAWGDAYDVRFERGAWIATSRDGEGRTFTADTPDALNVKVRADWAREGTL